MLKKINANYNTKTIGNAIAANSIESYIKSQEDDAGDTSDSTTEEKGGNNNDNNEKKKNFFKRVIEAIKHFLEKVRNFLRKVLQHIKTFFVKLFTKGDMQIVKENPFAGKESAYCFNVIDFSGIKKVLSTMEKFNVKVATSENPSAKVVSKTYNTIQKYPTDEKEILDKLFGIRMVSGEEAWKKANPKVIKTITQTVPKILESLDKILANQEKAITVIETNVSAGKMKFTITDETGKTSDVSAEEATKRCRECITAVQKITSVGHTMCNQAKDLIVPKEKPAKKEKGDNKPAAEKPAEEK